MLAKYEVADTKPPTKKRAKASATFEVMPALLGFDDSVQVTGVDVDYSRNMVTFYFCGDGLDEFGNLEHIEGQQCAEILPPLWQAMMEFKSSQKTS